MRWLVGFVVRLVSTILLTTFLLFCAIEISIPNGYRGVIFPNGMPPKGARSPRAEAIIAEFDFDDGLIVRWAKWVASAVQGDFRVSSGRRGGTDVVELIVPRLSISLQLIGTAAVLMVLVGIPLGVLAAARSGRRSGTALDTLAGAFQSIPMFISPIFLIWLFAIKLQWLPAAGWTRISDSLSGNLKGLILPMTSIALAEIGFVARAIRSDVVETLQQDYVAAAVGKGLGKNYVLFRHALRPASLGLLNVIGINIGALISGTFVIETIFGIGAMGSLLLGALLNRDLYLLLALTVFIVTVYVVLNALVDIAVHAADPRIRRS